MWFLLFSHQVWISPFLYLTISLSQLLCLSVYLHIKLRDTYTKFIPHKLMTSSQTTYLWLQGIAPLPRISMIGPTMCVRSCTIWWPVWPCDDLPELHWWWWKYCGWGNFKIQNVQHTLPQKESFSYPYSVCPVCISLKAFHFTSFTLDPVTCTTSLYTVHSTK